MNSHNAIYVSRRNERDRTYGKLKLSFVYIVCSREHSADHFDTKIMCLAQFLMELL